MFTIDRYLEHALWSIHITFSYTHLNFPNLYLIRYTGSFA
jgi:hypothetical protein